MYGFLFVDKPKGIASFDCVRKLRKALNVRRMGFAGTLDPLATGLLIVAVGEATKLLSYLEGLDKMYDVTIRFGAVSNTYDAEGEIVARDNVVRPTRTQIGETLEEGFLGEREQVPPAFSAVHIEGKRAYDLARRGEKVDLKPRKVAFYDLSLKLYRWPGARIVVHCSSGTYVRSFVHDLGQLLGCGAYVEQLRRTKIGSYSVKAAIRLDDITAHGVKTSMLKPQQIFSDWAQIELDKDRFSVLWNGGFVHNFADLQKGPALAIYKGVCIGVLEVHASGKLKLAKRLNIGT